MVVLFSSRPTTVLLFGTTNWTPYKIILITYLMKNNYNYLFIIKIILITYLCSNA